MWRRIEHPDHIIEVRYTGLALLAPEDWAAYQLLMGKLLHQAPAPLYVLSNLTSLRGGSLNICAQIGQSPYLRHENLAQLVIATDPRNPMHQLVTSLLEKQLTASNLCGHIQAVPTYSAALRTLRQCREADRYGAGLTLLSLNSNDQPVQITTH